MRTTLTSIFAATLLLSAPTLTRAQWTSNYDFVNIAGDFNGFETLTPNMTLVANGVWQHHAVITNTPNFAFLFATENFTNTWKEANQADFNTPIAATAEFNTGNDIVVSNAANRTFRFTLNENTAAYTVRDVSIPLVAAPNIWINEIDYDKPGTDSNEWVEIAGKAGLTLDAYEIVLINSLGTEYEAFDLNGAGLTFTDEANGYGFLVIGQVETSLLASADYSPPDWTNRTSVIQNGPLDSVQLRIKIGGANEHLVDYEGDNTFTLENQVAGADSSSAASTLFLTGGPGIDFGGFTWDASAGDATPGSINVGQSLTGVPSQPGSSIVFNDIKVTPFPPKVVESPHVSVNIQAVDGASNIVATTFYRVGSSGPFTPLPMTGIGNTYITDSSIPAQSAFTVVQYYVFAAFDGVGTNSPSLYPSAGTTAPFQYTVPNVQRGDVWLNELNYNPDPTDFGAPDTNEYVELAGLAGTDIGDWRVELLNTAGPYASYDIPPVTLLGNETNGFGFWVLGDSGVPAADALLTNLISGTQHLAKRGAIRIRDQFDQVHFEYSYGDPAPTLQFPDAIYIGFEDDFSALNDESLALVNTGSNYFDFVWGTNTTLTPGALNVTQSLVGGNTNDAAPVIVCPDDVFVQCVSDIPPANTNTVTASSSCGSGLVTVSHVGDTTSSGSACFNDPLIITRTYRAVSDCSTTSECTQTITVEDTTAPIIDCVATELTNPGFESASYIGWDATPATNLTVAFDDPAFGFFHSLMSWGDPLLLDDVSANGLDGSYGPGVAQHLVTGAHPNTGVGVAFAGNDTGATIPATNLINELTSDLTVAAWIRPDVVTGMQWILSQASAGGISMGLNGNGLRFSTVGVQDYDMSASIPTGEWTHVACVMDTDFDVTFYTNGVPLGTVVGTGPAVVSAQPITLAARGSSSAFQGAIDDIQVYGVALPSNEVFSLVQNPGSTTSIGTLLDPTSLSGLQLWLDANDAPTLTTVSSKVTQWRDKSGKNRHLEQTAAANRPLLVSATSPDRSTVQFDGTNDHLSRTDAIGLTGSPAMTVFIAGQSTEAESASMLALGSNTGAGGRQIAFWADSSFRYNNGNQIFANDPLTGSFRIATFQKTTNDQYRDGRMWVNGAEATPTSSSNNGGNPVDLLNEETLLGARRSSGTLTSYFDGEITEILIYNRALSDAERAAVEEYLLLKHNSPQSVSGLQLWLDATDPSTLTTVGSAVSQWRDKSGNTRHLAQSSAASRPLLVHTANPGRSALLFDGVNDRLLRTDALGLTGSPALTVFIAGQSTVAEATSMLALGSNTGAGGRQIAFWADSSFRYNNGNRVFANDPFTGGFRIATFQKTADDQYQDGRMWLDGMEATPTSTSNNGGNPVDLINEETLVGARRSSGSLTSFFDGEVTEILVFDRALSSVERTAIEEYLRLKYAPPQLVARYPLDDLGNESMIASQDLPAAPGQDWTAEADGQSAGSDPLINADQAYVTLTFLNGGGGVLQTTTSEILTAASPSGVYQPLTAEATAPAGTTTARINLVYDPDPSAGGSVYFDRADLTSLRLSSGITMECGAVAPDLTSGRIIATDNCGVPTVTQTPGPGMLLPVGESVVEFVAADCGGLSATCRVMVTVLDTTPPIVICPTNPTVQIDSSTMTGFLPDLVPEADISDACTPTNLLIIVQTPPASTIVSNTTMVELVATDTAGNAATCTVEVVAEVVSAIPPTVIILDVSLSGSTLEINSLGTNTWAFDLEYSTNLLDGPTGWMPMMNVTNVYLDGTNTTTFGNPDAPTVFFRTKQTEP